MDKTIWSMQLHPQKKNEFPPEVLLKILREYSVVGVGRDNCDAESFSDKAAIGDLIAVRSGSTFVALVEIVSDCYENGKQDEVCWFDLVRKVKMLDSHPELYFDGYRHLTKSEPSDGMKVRGGTFQHAWKCEFIPYWYESVKGNLEMEDWAKLIAASKNLILTGAPGTGKTYLAQQIAQWMTIGRVVDDAHPATDKERRALKDHVGFVQFHPSYDYSDFVEGLRPIKSEDSEAVGFERQDGVFKAFCKRAAISGFSGRTDNFEDAWKELIKRLDESENGRVMIENLSRTGTFPVEMNEFGTGLASRTYDEEGRDWIRGQSKFFNKEQLYRVYQGGAGVPSGAHDSYRRAILSFMEKNCHLEKFVTGTFSSDGGGDFVFIIDEINRGDLSKIFGELFYSIDPGYRVKHGANADVVKVQTRYANMIEDGDVFKDGFYVPDNVYIIGTMNDIDRSVESMDFAIRRRFTWKKVPADETRLAAVWGTDDSTASVTLEDVKPRYQELNKAIEECASDGLGEAFMIGPSYYLKLKGMGQGKDDCFKALWDLHLEPLLQEYVRGLPNALELMKKFENAYYRLERTDAAAAS